MTYAHTLRALGQLLEAAKVADFEVKKTGRHYILDSDSLTFGGEWIFRYGFSGSDAGEPNSRQSSAGRSLRLTQPDISRIDAEGKRRRTERSSTQTQALRTLSQSLRSLGDHLDRSAATDFHITWTQDSVTAAYHGPDGRSECRKFTAEKLQQLGLHTRIRRSHPGAGSNSAGAPGRKLR